MSSVVFLMKEEIKKFAAPNTSSSIWKGCWEIRMSMPCLLMQQSISSHKHKVTKKYVWKPLLFKFEVAPAVQTKRSYNFFPHKRFVLFTFYRLRGSRNRWTVRVGWRRIAASFCGIKMNGRKRFSLSFHTLIPPHPAQCPTLLWTIPRRSRLKSDLWRLLLFAEPLGGFRWLWDELVLAHRI